MLPFRPRDGLLTMRLLTALARGSRILSTIALAVMMSVTVVDVTMRNVINELVPGGVEIVQLALVMLVFLALPETVLRGEHITIDVIDRVVSPRAVAGLRMGAAAATLLLFLLLVWRTILPALDTVVVGDTTQDLGLSFIWYWLPLVLGVALAAAAQLALVVREFASLRAGERG